MSSSYSSIADSKHFIFCLIISFLDTFHVVDNLPEWFGIRLICGVNTVHDLRKFCLTDQQGSGGRVGCVDL